MGCLGSTYNSANVLRGAVPALVQLVLSHADDTLVSCDVSVLQGRLRRLNGGTSKALDFQGQGQGSSTVLNQVHYISNNIKHPGAYSTVQYSTRVTWEYVFDVAGGAHKLWNLFFSKQK